MEKSKINVLIGDDTAEFGVRIAAELREAGIYAYTRRNNGGTILDSLIRNKPDVAVIDLTTPEMDAMVLMRKAAELMDKKPVFIVVSDIDNSFIERQITEGGAEFFLPKPFDTSQWTGTARSPMAETSNLWLQILFISLAFLHISKVTIIFEQP